MAGYVNAPIHDLLIRIKNAYMARKDSVEWVVYSKFKDKILLLLKKYNFISDYSVHSDWNKKYLSVSLNSISNSIDGIPNIKFYSKPSRSWYVWYADLKSVANWKGIWIISTNKWLMAVHEARKLKIWWELIAEIY